MATLTDAVFLSGTIAGQVLISWRGRCTFFDSITIF